MATKCDSRQYFTETELSSVGEEVSTGYNLRKQVGLNEKDDSSFVSQFTIVKGKGKWTYGEESENTPDPMKKTSLQPLKSHSQQRLKEIYQKKRYRPVPVNFETDSEESRGVHTLEELQKTDGYKLFLKGLDAMRGKPQS